MQSSGLSYRWRSHQNRPMWFALSAYVICGRLVSHQNEMEHLHYIRNSTAISPEPDRVRHWWETAASSHLPSFLLPCRVGVITLWLLFQGYSHLPLLYLMAFEAPCLIVLFSLQGESIPPVAGSMPTVYCPCHPPSLTQIPQIHTRSCTHDTVTFSVSSSNAHHPRGSGR